MFKLSHGLPPTSARGGLVDFHQHNEYFSVEVTPSGGYHDNEREIIPVYFADDPASTGRAIPVT